MEESACRRCESDGLAIVAVREQMRSSAVRCGACVRVDTAAAVSRRTCCPRSRSGLRHRTETWRLLTSGVGRRDEDGGAETAKRWSGWGSTGKDRAEANGPKA